MIEIDGRHGEGGGQILRTALALSVLTGKPARIHHIRSRRTQPGLKPQHRMSAQAAAQICGGKLIGAELGADDLSLFPGRLQPGEYTFDVGALTTSAGSTSLIFQTVFLPLAFSGKTSRILLKGGTHVAWSPPSDYLEEVFLHAMAMMGVRAKLNLHRAGFYPIGGGEIEALLEPAHLPLRPLRIEERGGLKRLRVVSAAAHLPPSIAERQLKRAAELLGARALAPQREIRSLESPGKGTYCFIQADFENVRAGFSSVGAIGKRAERVGEEAAGAFLRYWNRTGALDRHLADQMALPMALAGGESVATLLEVTDHLKTNIWVVEQFLPVKFRIEENAGGSGTLRVAGAAFRGAGT